MDLFDWGCSGWNNGSYDYLPHEIDDVPGHFLPNDLTGTYADADWAWFNAIANGGNTPNQWRTLTFLEWIYLLEERTNNTNLGTANARFAKGAVNNV